MAQLRQTESQKKRVIASASEAIHSSLQIASGFALAMTV
jgi:hypothetical protein